MLVAGRGKRYRGFGASASLVRLRGGDADGYGDGVGQIGWRTIRWRLEAVNTELGDSKKD